MLRVNGVGSEAIFAAPFDFRADKLFDCPLLISLLVKPRDDVPVVVQMEFQMVLLGVCLVVFLLVFALVFHLLPFPPM